MWIIRKCSVSIFNCERVVYWKMCVISIIVRIVNYIISNILHHCILSWIYLKASTVNKVGCLRFCVALLCHKIVSKLIDKFIYKIRICCSTRSSKFNTLKSCINIIRYSIIVFFIRYIALFFHISKNLILSVFISVCMSDRVKSGRTFSNRCYYCTFT